MRRVVIEGVSAAETVSITELIAHLEKEARPAVYHALKDIYIERQHFELAVVFRDMEQKNPDLWEPPPGA